MNLDNAKNAQADILRQVLGYREVGGTYAIDDEEFPTLAPDFQERNTAQLSSGDRHRVRSHWDRRAAIGIGIRPPQTDFEHGGERRQEAREAVRGDDRFGIAIFVQRQNAGTAELVRKSIELAAGEAEVFVTGPVNTPGSVPAHRPRGPLEIGCSVGHPGTSAGTLGCFASAEGRMGAISNAHVFSPGLYAKLGDKSLSPGTRDGGRDPADVFGELARAEPIDYAASAVNQVDCAWARLNDGVAYDQFSLKGAGAPGRPARLSQKPAVVVARERVGKIGRSTNLTWGNVIAINTNVIVRVHATNFSRLAHFGGQLTLGAPPGRFSLGGDSGSVIFTEDFDPAGLLFAGSSAPVNGVFVTYANPISLVLGALGVTL